MTGGGQILAQEIDSTRYEGQTLVVLIWEQDASFQPNTGVFKERQIKGTIAYRRFYPARDETDDAWLFLG